MIIKLWARDDNIPDEMCHVIEWEDHINCEHDKTKRTVKLDYIICTKRKYRFLKEPMGVIPSLLMNLLNARSNTKKEIKEIKKKLKVKKTEKLETLLTVLDKRQLSYKISANSMYGAMGVRRGFLPFFAGGNVYDSNGEEIVGKGCKNIAGKI